MNKKILFIYFIILIILTSCSDSVNSRETTEIFYIFNKDGDYSNYLGNKEVLLNEFSDIDGYSEAAVITENGAVNIVTIENNKINIEDFNNIKGIYLSNNFYSITDTYYDTKYYLDNNKKVMVILLDGFSLEQYKYAKENGHVTFLSNYYKNEALSVYTPVTNAGYAGIITGQTPNINGVHNRSNRELKVDSIFKYANDSGKNTLLLEGDIKILNTEIEPTLHIDSNKNGDTDDEMFGTLVNASKDDYDFIFAHFHGIDDRGHSYGPNSEEILEYIKKIDSYIEEISNMWKGTIIITSDHGMHETEEGGSHGECISSDMIVPYFIIN